MKIWKRRKEKAEIPETIDAVYTHKHNLKEKNVTLNGDTQNTNKIKTRRTWIIMPLIVVLMLICVISTILVVGSNIGGPSEIAQKLKTKIQQILPASDVSATSVGTNVKANFTGSTGEIHIYSLNPSSPGTIDKSLLWTFYGKCGATNIKKIIIDIEVYAPEDASNLFRLVASDSTSKILQT